MTAERYPLTWPAGWVRTPPASRRRAAFCKVVTRNSSTPGQTYKVNESLTISDGMGRLHLELRRLGAQDVIVSSNLQTRGDGLPYAKQGKMLEDPGVAVYFKLNSKARVLACDKWLSAAENMAAIAGHIFAIRAQDRYGVGTLDQAFAGYAQLPPSAVDWRIVLGLTQPRPTRDDIIAAHRALLQKHHPDKGGRHVDMARINEARDIALRELAS
jgi:hypothetical protein